MYNKNKSSKESKSYSKSGHVPTVRGGVLCDTMHGMETVKGGQMTGGNKAVGNQVRGGQLA